MLSKNQLRILPLVVFSFFISESYCQQENTDYRIEFGEIYNPKNYPTPVSIIGKNQSGFFIEFGKKIDNQNHSFLLRKYSFDLKLLAEEKIGKSLSQQSSLIKVLNVDKDIHLLVSSASTTETKDLYYQILNGETLETSFSEKILTYGRNIILETSLSPDSSLLMLAKYLKDEKTGKTRIEFSIFDKSLKVIKRKLYSGDKIRKLFIDNNANVTILDEKLSTNDDENQAINEFKIVDFSLDNESDTFKINLDRRLFFNSILSLNNGSFELSGIYPYSSLNELKIGVVKARFDKTRSTYQRTTQTQLDFIPPSPDKEMLKRGERMIESAVKDKLATYNVQLVDNRYEPHPYLIGEKKMQVNEYNNGVTFYHHNLGSLFVSRFDDEKGYENLVEIDKYQYGLSDGKSMLSYGVMFRPNETVILYNESKSGMSIALDYLGHSSTKNKIEVVKFLRISNSGVIQVENVFGLQKDQFFFPKYSIQIGENEWIILTSLPFEKHQLVKLKFD